MQINQNVLVCMKLVWRKIHNSYDLTQLSFLLELFQTVWIAKKCYWLFMIKLILYTGWHTINVLGSTNVFLCTYLSGALDSVIFDCLMSHKHWISVFIPYVFIIWLRKLIALGRVMYRQSRCKGDVNTITSPYQLKKMAKVWGRVWNQNTLM